MKSNRLSTDIKLILKITLAWMILGVIFTLYDYLTTSDSEFYIRTENYNFPYHYGLKYWWSVSWGTFWSFFYYFIYQPNFASKHLSLYTYFLIHFSVLTVIALINIVISMIVISIRFDLGLLNSVVIQNSMNFILSLQGIKSLLVWFCVTVITIFLLRVNEKYGPGILKDIILGKYHQTKR